MVSLYQWCRGYPLCALLVAGALLLMSDAAHPELTELQLYGRHGSDVVFPGVETELQGEGVLEWLVKKPGDQEPQWILTYHYGSDEPQTFHKYERRIFFSPTNASLRLLNLTHHDDGLYILHLMFVDKNHVLLRVIEPISEIKIMKILSSGDSSVRLMCEASGDVWNLAWRNNGGELIQNITHEGNTSELVIKEVRRGSYICIAWNPISQQETSYQIAQESAVILYIVGLLTAAVVFGLPFFISQVSFLICQKEYCPRVLDKACPACNLAFLVVLVSSFSMDSLWLICKKRTKSQSQDNWKQKLRQWIRQHMEGPLNVLRLALRHLVFLGSLLMLVLYFCTDVCPYGKPTHFGWTFSFAVVVPVVVVIFIHWCCRPNGRISRWLDRHNTDRSEQPGDTELAKLTSKVSDDAYRPVSTGGDPTVT